MSYNVQEFERVRKEVRTSKFVQNLYELGVRRNLAQYADREAPTSAVGGKGRSYRDSDSTKSGTSRR